MLNSEDVCHSWEETVLPFNVVSPQTLDVSQGAEEIATLLLPLLLSALLLRHLEFNKVR